MPVPLYIDLIHPVLKGLARHPNGIRVRDLRDELAKDLGLTSDDRAKLLPSGTQPVFDNRVGWAHDRLKRKGLSTSLTKGFWRLTDQGRAFISDNPNGLDANTLKDLWKVPLGGLGSGPAQADGVATSSPTAVPPAVAPEERIDEAVREIQESVSADLLEQIGNAPPAFFERLVLDLLVAMGYGTDELSAEHVGGTGDGGIDGVIALDRLGLEKVYVQAKRWKGTVGRPEVQGFFGALAERKAAKGVFITTSSFSSEARNFASSVSASLVLVDGEMLTRLMIEAGVGVSVQRTVKVVKVDGDYFEGS